MNGSDERFRDLRCMSFALKGSHEILVAGCQDMMFKIDVEKGGVSQTVCDPLVLHEIAITISTVQSIPPRKATPS